MAGQKFKTEMWRRGTKYTFSSVESLKRFWEGGLDHAAFAKAGKVAQIIGLTVYVMDSVQKHKEKNRVVESMTKVYYEGWTIRVWRTESPVVSDFAYPNGDIENNLKAVKPDGVHEIAAVLDRLGFIAAYEILDHRGNGVVVYPDWS